VLNWGDYLYECMLYIAVEDFWKHNGLCLIYYITDHMSLTRSKQSQGAREVIISLHRYIEDNVVHNVRVDG
jgi:hypothetical protein